MKTPRWFNRNRVLSNARIIAALVLILAAAAMAFMAASPHAVAQPTAAPTPPLANQQLSPEEARLRDDWRVSMAQVPLPKKGCFQSTYPSREWQEVTCTTAPNIPFVPRRGPRPLVVGNGDDISAQAPSGFISTAIGSFDSATNVTSESGPIGNTGPSITNAYTLQINTNQFQSTVCSGAAVPMTCRGWEQFIFANDGSSGVAFIQYWLISYNNPCPAGGWTSFPYPGPTDISCYRNSAGTAAFPNQPVTSANLPQLVLSGTAAAGSDGVAMSAGGTMHSAAGDNSVNAAAGWTIAEFNLVGYGGNSSGGGMASFNSGADIVPRTRIIYGGTLPPPCVAQGFTGETNNLSFGPTAPASSAPGPAVIFRESTAGGATSNCMAAVSVGDTHLHTFGGLFYDFQASGDFVLAQVDPDFVVQTRQISGAPTWPDASVNSAVATRMGKSKVAICLPARLNVDGENTELGDGKSLSTPGGVDIWRRGNVYFITDQSGNSVRAVVNPTWIDVSVGLGRWPAKVTGLLANADGNVNKIEARDGTVLTNPFPFEDLYHRYADSWRVGSSESLLSVCGDRNVERGIPRRPFYANDLDPRVYERTRAVCTAAGVKAGPLLDACTLDVAVIGDDKAAQVFVNAPEPVAVGKPVVNKTPGLIKWLLLLILIVIIVWLLLFLKKRKTP
jgi:hypothetical protein